MASTTVSTLKYFTTSHCEKIFCTGSASSRRTGRAHILSVSSAEIIAKLTRPVPK